MDPDPHLVFRLDPDPYKTDADPKHMGLIVIIFVPYEKLSELVDWVATVKKTT
jgi:hypothetical protein